MTAVVEDAFRAFAAASQGDWERAANLMVEMDEEQFTSLTLAVGGLHGLVHAANHERRERARLAATPDPSATPSR